MSKVKDENFYQISGWMINRLKLKGTTLNVYAIIYGFTQDGESEFKGSRQYLCNFTGATKPTIDKSIDYLVNQDLIFKKTEIINNITFNKYMVNLEKIKNFTTDKETLPPDKETLLGGSKETLPPDKETLPNNIYNNNTSNNTINNIDNNIDKENSNINITTKEKQKSTRFVPPTEQEIYDYANSRGRGDLAKMFYDYYTATEWYDTKGKRVQSWKGKFITWEKNNPIKTQNKPNNKSVVNRDWINKYMEE